MASPAGRARALASYTPAPRSPACAAKLGIGHAAADDGAAQCAQQLEVAGWHRSPGTRAAPSACYTSLQEAATRLHSQPGLQHCGRHVPLAGRSHTPGHTVSQIERFACASHAPLTEPARQKSAAAQCAMMARADAQQLHKAPPRRVLDFSSCRRGA